MLLWYLAAISFAWQIWLSPETSAALHVVLAIAAIACVWRLQARHYGVWDPGAIYLGLASLYVLAPLMEVSFFGNALALDPLKASDAADLGVAFLLPAAIGMSIGRPHASVQCGAPLDQANSTRLWVAVACCAGLVAVYVLMVSWRYGLTIGSMTRGEMYASEFVELSILRATLIGGFAFALAVLKLHQARDSIAYARARTWIALALFGFAIPDLLILGDRRAVLVTILGAAALFAPKGISGRQLLFASSGAALLLLYGFVRNTPPSEWMERLASVDLLVQISPAAQEFGGYAVISNAIDNWTEMPADFPGYLSAVPQLLPASIFPDRPLAPSEWFIWEYFPELAAAGASFAFNTVFEAMVNGGVPAVLLAGTLVGFLIGRLSAWTWRGAPIGPPIAVSIFAFSMRMELASILRTAVSTLIAVAIFVALTEAVCWIVRALGMDERQKEAEV